MLCGGCRSLLCTSCSSHGLSWLVCLAGRNRRALCDINKHVQHCDQGRGFIPVTSTQGNHKCLVHIPTCVWDLFEALCWHYFEIKFMSALITFAGAVMHSRGVKINPCRLRPIYSPLVRAVFLFRKGSRVIAALGRKFWIFTRWIYLICQTDRDFLRPAQFKVWIWQWMLRGTLIICLFSLSKHAGYLNLLLFLEKKLNWQTFWTPLFCLNNHWNVMVKC